MNVDEIVKEVGKVLLGKEHQVKLALACLLARGHLLIEDLPGLGKTTLAHALAKVLGLDYNRVQFTSDMLPADLTGFSMYNKENENFHFQQGPLFTQVLLADEINRSSPKTQSALLEAMEEFQISVDGKTYPLDEPFFVIATQNPFSLAGTYPLPESQLDRFLLRISLGYPSENVEKAILSGINPRAKLNDINAVSSLEELRQVRQTIQDIRVSDAVLQYVLRLLAATRSGEAFVHGISPRGGIALMNAAKAWAILEQRDYLTPDDIQAVLPSVFSHRLVNQAGQQCSISHLEKWMNTIEVMQV